MFDDTMLPSPEISSPANASVWKPGPSSPLSSRNSEEDSLSRQRIARNIILAKSGCSLEKKSLTVPWATASSRTHSDYVDKAKRINFTRMFILIYKHSNSILLKETLIAEAFIKIHPFQVKF